MNQPDQSYTTVKAEPLLAIVQYKLLGLEQERAWHDDEKIDRVMAVSRKLLFLGTPIKTRTEAIAHLNQHDKFFPSILAWGTYAELRALESLCKAALAPMGDGIVHLSRDDAMLLVGDLL